MKQISVSFYENCAERAIFFEFEFRLVTGPAPPQLNFIEAENYQCTCFFNGAGSNGFLAGNMHYEGQL
jgi:hypothetical protein